jgi:hypothetical protein
MNTNFQSKINNLFSHFKIKNNEIEENFCENSSSKIELRSYQKFVGEYLKNMNENIRGLYVIHGLGSGKTLTSINAIKEMNIKNVIIILPASLKGNWKSEIDKNIDKTIKINFISYNAPNVMNQYHKLGEAKIKESYKIKEENYFNNKLVIIEESHLFFKNVISGDAKQATKLWDKLYESKKSKFLFLTGTPISGDPYELIPAFNLLRKPKSGFSLFPISYINFHDYFVSKEFNSIKNKEIFQDRITGLVSYYKGIKDPNRFVIPEYLGTEIIKCQMGDVQWDNYLIVRNKELEMEKRNMFGKNKKMIQNYKKPTKDVIGTYKVLSSQTCNFSFPKIIEKKFKKLKLKGMKIKNPTEYKWKMLIVEYGKDKFEKYISENIKSLSNKANILINNITDKKKENKKIFVFSKFKILGVRIIGLLLRSKGYIEIKENEIPNKEDFIENRKAFIIIDGNTKDKSKMFNFYNRPDNLYGKKCQIVIGTSVVSTGVSFFDVREEHIYESQWGSLEQIKGRGIRTCSHTSLKISERDVKVYLYLSVAPSILKKVSLLSDKGKTTDEFLYEFVERKSILNNTFINTLKESAVDCKFNLIHNDLDGFCRYCVNDPSTLLFPEDIKKHIIEGSYCVTKEKKVTLSDFSYEGISYKKDLNDNLYLWSKDKKSYEEVGYYDKKNNIINLEGYSFDF